MPQNTVSYQELYDLVDKRTTKIETMFENWKVAEFNPLKQRVEKTEDKVNSMWVYMGIAGAIVMVILESLIKRFFNTTL